MSKAWRADGGGAASWLLLVGEGREHWRGRGAKASKVNMHPPRELGGRKETLINHQGEHPAFRWVN